MGEVWGELLLSFLWDFGDCAKLLILHITLVLHTWWIRVSSSNMCALAWINVRLVINSDGGKKVKPLFEMLRWVHSLFLLVLLECEEVRVKIGSSKYEVKDSQTWHIVIRILGLLLMVLNLEFYCQIWLKDILVCVADLWCRRKTLKWYMLILQMSGGNENPES